MTKRALVAVVEPIPITAHPKHSGQCVDRPATASRREYYYWAESEAFAENFRKPYAFPSRNLDQRTKNSTADRTILPPDDQQNPCRLGEARPQWSHSVKSDWKLRREMAPPMPAEI